MPNSMISICRKLIVLLLRIPPLLIVDFIFQIGLMYPIPYNNDTDSEDVEIESSDMTFDEETTNITYTVHRHYNTTTYAMHIFLILVRLSGSAVFGVSALVIALLRLTWLLRLYSVIIFFSIPCVSYLLNSKIINSNYSSDEDLSAIVQMTFWPFTSHFHFMPFVTFLFLQAILGAIFYGLYPATKYKWLRNLVFFSFVTPTCLSLLPLSTWAREQIPRSFSILPFGLLNFVFWLNISNVIDKLHQSFVYTRAVMINFGLPALLESEWTRVDVPNLLRLFWVSKCFINYVYYSDGNSNNSPEFDHVIHSICTYSRYLLVKGCETIPTVIGLTSIVSYFCELVGSLFRALLLTDDDEKNFGMVSAVLFLTLAIQTGLTSLEPDKRYVRLGRNFCLLFIALLHIVHGMLHPVLMSLGAAHSTLINKHTRALMVSTILIIYPSVLMIYLWSNYPISTWLLAVTAFSIEVIIKVAISLIIYFLFLFDSLRSVFWEELDDYVYYIKSFGNTIEFCFGVFLFFNGAWILLFESGGTIRAAMMGIHAYFNIWCEAKSGWLIFMKRRTAAKKINTLPDADPDQLDGLQDVCSICYQQMYTAKITNCNHYFHAVCLRKWLYVQDHCPLCHHVIYDSVAVNSTQENIPAASDNVNGRHGGENNR